MDSLIASNKLTLIFSEELIGEFLEVVKRPKFSKLFKQTEIDELLNLFGQFSEVITVVSELEYCRDAKDNFLLNLAIDGNVDFLVTGDSDLLVLKKIKKTKILSYQEFLTHMK